ncbi:MAG: hypothetical protein QW270_04700 [Candidatus Bathyarchaeia archaeon]
MGETTERSKPLTFDELVAEIVDEVLKSKFSERFAYFVWMYLGTTASIERIDIARKPEAFSTTLRNLLGSAAQVLEKLILKSLCQHLNVKLKEGYKFSDYINELRKVYVAIEYTKYKKFLEG